MLWLLAVLSAFWLGYKLNELQRRIDELKTLIDALKQPQAPPVPRTTILDPEDPISMAQLERENLLRKINQNEMPAVQATSRSGTNPTREKPTNKRLRRLRSLFSNAR